MASDTPRLPKGPKPHKFNPLFKDEPYCDECGKLKSDPLHLADADPPPGDPDTGN
jgi:hypothetical protein